MAIINGTEKGDKLTGTEFQDEIYGLAGNDDLDGMQGDDFLYGGEANDDLDGGAGNDTLIGGTGNDVYRFGRGYGQDVIIENDSPVSSTDTIKLANDILPSEIILTRDHDNLYLTIAGTGDRLTITDWFISDNAKVEKIVFGDGITEWDVPTIYSMTQPIATEGDDVLYGTTFNETIDGLGGNDVIYGLAGDDTLSGGDGNDTIYGEEGIDTLNGGAGDDILDGGTGNDTFVGGVGNDTYIVDNTGEGVTENAGEGIDTVQSSATYTLGDNIENLTLTGTDAINGTGNALDNVLTGNSADNTLTGGAGNDTYIVDNAGDVVTESAGEGIDIIQSSATYTLGANVENLTLTGIATINGTGNTLDNVLTGNIADNILDGGAGADMLIGGGGNDTLYGNGADTLIGGAGNDTYIVDSSSDVVVENAGEGTDTVQSSLSYTLGSVVENLTLTGTVAINGTGNALDNVLTGNSAANVLDGGAGGDTLIGGGGNDTLYGSGADSLQGGTGDDTYIIDPVGITVVENADEGIDTIQVAGTYTLGANLDNLTLTGSGAINGIGNAMDNVLTGNSANNTLTGGAGNDTLNGLAGSDTLVGGTGDDTYVLDVATDVVTENANEGTDTIQSTFNYTLGATLENLTLIEGSAAVTGTGNAANNVIIGNSNTNILDGSTGQDTLKGGAGNDTYNVDNAGDVVVENQNEGTDLVITSLSSYTLSNNVENLTMTGNFGVIKNGTGNALNNVIDTTSGYHDVLNGQGGADTMIGGDYNDTYNVDNAGDVVVEGNAYYSGYDTAKVTTDGLAYTLSANVERLEFLGVGVSGTGNGLNNYFVVNDVQDRVYENANQGYDTVESSVDFTLSDNVERLILTGTGLTGTGGAGDNTFVVSDAGNVIVENANAGTDTVETSLTSYTLSNNVENLTMTGNFGVIKNGTGNALNNVIDTTSGYHDVLNGQGGADTMIGGDYNDTYNVDNAGDVVVEGNAYYSGYDTAKVTTDGLAYTLSANVERLELQGVGVSGTGNGLNNYFVVNDVQDRVYENANQGYDTVESSVDFTLSDNVERLILTGTGLTGTGGAGDNTFVVSDAGNVIVENANAGTDTVETSLTSYTLSNNVENLTMTGNFGVIKNGTGNALNNVIDTTSGYHDVLNGQGGADTMIGGDYNDTYNVDNAGDVVVEGNAYYSGYDTAKVTTDGLAYTLSANVERLEFLGVGVSGTGNGLNNYFVVNDVQDRVYENANQGYDTVESSVDFTLSDNVERLILTGTGLTGTGGAGDNTFVVSDAGNVIVENANAGTDTVETSLTSYTLSNNVENLTMTGNFGVIKNGTGNALNNVIDTTSGYHDVLNGQGGADTMIGGDYNDTYNVDNAGDVVVEGNAYYSGYDTAKVTTDGLAYTLSANVERLELQGVGVSGTGNGLNNYFVVNDVQDRVYENANQGYDTVESSVDFTLSDNVERLILTGTGLTGTGGAGDNTFVVSDAGNVIVENANAGTDTVETSLTSYTLSNNVENLTMTGNFGVIKNGTGNALNNVIDTTSGYHDVLNGQGGADTMIGGDYNDTYNVDNAGDVVVEGNAYYSGYDTAKVTTDGLAYTLSANVERLEFLGVGVSGTGNGLNNYFVVNDVQDRVYENANQGYDTVESSVDFTLSDNVERLILTGTGLTGTGGAGDNTFVVSDAGNVIVENANAGTDTVETSLTSYTLSNNVENLTMTGNFGVIKNGTGNALNNVIDTTSGYHDVLNGQGGADTMIGGDYNDTYNVDNAGDVVVEGNAYYSGYDTAKVTTDGLAYTLSANVERLEFLGVGVSGTGNGLNNYFVVNDVQDRVYENANQGYDTVESSVDFTLSDNVERLILTGTGLTGTGGAGDNTFVVSDAGNVIVENANAGTDTVETSLTSYTLSNNVENLTMTGNFGVIKNGTGNALNNVIDTTSGYHDVLNGQGGADTMIGGDYNDTYNVDNAGDVVVEGNAYYSGYDTAKVTTDGLAYTLSANVERLEFLGVGVSGTGNGLNNYFVVNDVQDRVYENANQGYDTVESSVDFTLSDNVERLILTGTGLTGTGGAGDNTFVVSDAGNVIVENANAGTDTVETSLTSYTLSNNVENLTMTGNFGVIKNGTGNALNNVIDTTSGYHDVLNGQGGADTMIGGDYNDTYNVDNAGDVVVEGNAYYSGYDTAISSVSYSLSANVESLVLSGSAAINATGNASNNVLTGNSNANTLTGLAGNDILVGGAGNDTYVLGRGDGSDTIRENDVTTGNTDTASFGTGIATDQLWFRQVGNNLEATIIGTSDMLTIENWYSGSSYHVDQFLAADNKVLLDTQVDALVNAMAAFTPPTAGQTSLPQNYQDALAPVIAANWQ